LTHVFAVDVTVCVKCGGPMRLVAFATTLAAIARVLARAGLGAQPPPCSPQTRVHQAQLRLAFGKPFAPTGNRPAAVGGVRDSL
jgi:hypothetical protein